MSVLPVGFGATASASGPTIQNSLRLRASASAYGSWTPSSAGNRQTFTISAVIKRGALSTTQNLISAAVGASEDRFFFTTGDAFTVGFNGVTNYVTTSNLFRDPAAFVHLVIRVDTTQATAANRIRVYANGVECSYSASSYMAQNYNCGINNSVAHNFCRHVTAANEYVDGVIGHFILVSGQSLAPSVFGVSNSNGEWKPYNKATIISNVGSFGTNGRFYDFADTTNTTTLGYDVSGLANHMTLTNVSLTSGVTYDAFIDSPTNATASDTRPVGNYCTLNPLDKHSDGALSEGNLTWTWQTASPRGVRGTTAIPTSGKYYWEATVGQTTTASKDTGFGFAKYTQGLANNDTGVSGGYIAYAVNTSRIITLGSSSGSGAAFSAGDVLQIAIDATNGNAWFGKNNTWYNSTLTANGDPAGGTNTTWSGLSTNLAAGMAPFVEVYDNNITFNFGQRPFAYTPPTGYKALCTTNMTQSAVAKPYEHFTATTRSGNSTSGTVVTNSNILEVGFVWIKCRNAADDHRLANIITGGNKHLKVNTTEIEQTGTTVIQAISGKTYTLGSDHSVNFTGRTYIDWVWKANGAGVANTAGSIASTVSANTTAGFSIVTYTGTGVNATVGHGLGVAPSMIIIKNRVGDGYDFVVYHKSLGANHRIFLNLTQPAWTPAGWNNTSPTNSVFSLGAGYNETNANGASMIAYCFAEIDGFSKFGSYTGNGSADGPFVWCGFRPRWVLFKCSSAGESWILVDAARNTYNIVSEYLVPNLANAAGTTDYLDFTANGFKIRHSGGNGMNVNAATYIFAAFAEYPFAANANAR